MTGVKVWIFLGKNCDWWISVTKLSVRVGFSTVVVWSVLHFMNNTTGFYCFPYNFCQKHNILVILLLQPNRVGSQLFTRARHLKLLCMWFSLNFSSRSLASLQRHPSRRLLAKTKIILCITWSWKTGCYNRLCPDLQQPKVHGQHVVITVSFVVQWDNEEQISDIRIFQLIYLSNLKKSWIK